MAKKTHLIQTFVVEGGVPFPLDMLRYDSAWPRSSDDAAKIAATHNQLSEVSLGRQRITLNRAIDESYREPTYGRWSSFLWTVVEVDGGPVISERVR